MVCRFQEWKWMTVVYAMGKIKTKIATALVTAMLSLMIAGIVQEGKPAWNSMLDETAQEFVAVPLSTTTAGFATVVPPKEPQIRHSTATMYVGARFSS
jgi:hypothetical protein